MLSEQTAMLWREKLNGCPHYHAYPEGVGVCDANEMRPCVYETDPGASCEILQEILKEWQEEYDRDYILARLSPCYPEDEVRLMVNGETALPEWLIAEMRDKFGKEGNSDKTDALRKADNPI